MREWDIGRRSYFVFVIWNVGHNGTTCLAVVMSDFEVYAPHLPSVLLGEKKDRHLRPVEEIGKQDVRFPEMPLVKAEERFDPAKGGKLSTYAAWWIKQSIKRALANQSKTIRLPVHLVDKISKMRRVSLQMSEELGREPTDEELGDEIGIASGKVSQLKTVSIRPASLDAPISDDDSTEFGEIVGDEEAQTPFELLRDKNLRNEVGGLLDVLDEREKKIIFQRFGLDGGKPKTLEEVGKKFGVTRERIRQLQNIALSKLRRALAKKERPVDVELPVEA